MGLQLAKALVNLPAVNSTTNISKSIRTVGVALGPDTANTALARSH